MMKKICRFVLCLLLVLGLSTAFAEEFSLRNGIKFGDSMDDVLAKETFEIDEIKDTLDEGKTEDDYGDKNTPYRFRTKKFTLAGISDSYIDYWFDKYKQLILVKYHFPSVTSSDTADIDYEDLVNGLARKYGSPLGLSNRDCYVYTDLGAITEAIVLTYYIEESDGYGKLLDYDEWGVDVDGGHVKIEIAEYYIGQSYSSLKYNNVMSYVFFTDDDLAQVQDEKHERQDAVDSDL